MKKTIFITVLAAITFIGCKKDKDDTQNQVNATDASFGLEASMAGTAEMDAGQMAVSKGTDPAVIAFGQTMVNDHGTSRSELHDITSDFYIYSPDSLNAQQQALKLQLTALTGRAFDSVYIHSQVTAHTQAITLFQGEINNGMNARLKDYAGDQIPHLNTHLQNAQNVAANY